MNFNQLIQGCFSLLLVNLAVNPAQAAVNFPVSDAPIYQSPISVSLKAGAKSPITEQNLRNILDQMAAAANNQEIDRLLGFYAPNYTGEVTISTATGSETRTMNRTQSRERLELSYQTIQNYQFSYSQQEITISDDGKTAKVVGTSTEEFTLQGKDYRSTSAWTINFQVIDGKILIVSDSSVVMDLQEVSSR